MATLGRVGIRKAGATGGGEVNSGVNVGVGTGQVFKDKPALDLRFKTILAGAGITVNNLTDEVEIVSLAANHNLLSATHPDTLAATPPIAGDLVVGNVTPLWARFPRGSINEVLIATAANINWALIQNVNLASGVFSNITGIGVQTQNLNMGGLDVTSFSDLVSNLGGVSITAAAGLGWQYDVPAGFFHTWFTGGSGRMQVTDTQLTMSILLQMQANEIRVTGGVLGDILKHGATGFLRFARGTGNQFLKVNSGGTDILYETLSNAFLPIGSAFQRKRTNSGATAIEDFTEEAGLVFTIGDGVAVISTGVKMHIRVPFDLEVTRWTLLAKQSGSIVVDVNRFTSLANFDADTKLSITGTDTPDLVADRGDESTALTGWTTVLSQGDILEVEVDSATTITRVTLVLRVNKRG